METGEPPDYPPRNADVGDAQRGRRIMRSEGFDRLVREWLLWGGETRGWTSNTRTRLGYQARQAEKWIVHHRATSLRFARFDDVEAFWRSAGTSAGSKNNHRAGLCAWFDWLNATGKRADNPAAELPRLRQKRAVPKVLDDRQVMDLLAAADAHGRVWSVLTRLMAYAGLRHDEARTLEWEAFEDQYRWLRFYAKPNGKERVQPVHPDLADHAAAWRSACPCPRFVVPSPRGPGRPASKTWLGDGIRDLGEAAGIDGLHPHLIRHSFATSLMDQGATLVEVKEALGHESIATTSIYLRARPQGLRDAIVGLSYHGETQP